MLTSVKVLLVDDRPENLVALRALLLEPGVELLEAHSGPEALELLLRHDDVALALLDVQMPGMDGFELAELMRGTERTKRVPIVFLTAGTHDPQRAFKGYETGAVDFLYKPVDERVLRSKVGVFLELHRQRMDLLRALHVNELFVGILGHDLRTPLGAIATGVGLLQAQAVEPRHLVTLRRMQAAAGRMGRLIEHLLDVTRVRLGGGLELRPVASKLTSLARRAIDELESRHPGREVALHATGNAQVVVDPDRLFQVFSNLIGNALEHGLPDSAVRVHVDAARADAVSVQVHNQGEIPRHVLPSLFDPFRSTRPTGGLGLGLYITQQIVHAHGGTIRAATQDGATVFEVELPRSA